MQTQAPEIIRGSQRTRGPQRSQTRAPQVFNAQFTESTPASQQTQFSSSNPL